MFVKFWNRYYFVGPALWEVRSAGLLLYSSRARGYSRRMISSDHQWPTEARAFIARCFSFRKNIVSVNPRGLAALVTSSLLYWHYAYWRNRRRRGAIVCIRWASAFRGLRVARYVGQLLSVLLRAFATGKNANFTQHSSRVLHFLFSTDIIYCTKIYREK